MKRSEVRILKVRIFGRSGFSGRRPGFLLKGQDPLGLRRQLFLGLKKSGPRSEKSGPKVRGQDSEGQDSDKGQDF